MNSQLKLSHEKLLQIGFEKKMTTEDEMNPAREYYSIPYQHGTFIYNSSVEGYEWYQNIRISKESGYGIQLDITQLPALYTLFQAFGVKFNLVI